jgi:hypothetical protein
VPVSDAGRFARRAHHCFKIRYGSPIYLSEVLALSLRHGLRVKKFRSTYIGGNERVSVLRMRDLLKAGIAIFEISVRYHFLDFARYAPQAAISSDSEPERNRIQSKGRGA